MDAFFEKPVKDVMTTNLLTIDIKKKINDAVEMLCENNVGSLLIVREGKIFGVVSETDIVREIVACGLAPGEITIEKLINRPPLSIDGTTSIKEAYYAMALWKVRHLLITDKGDEIGLISVRDILYAPGRRNRTIHHLSKEPIETIMTKNLVIVSGETTVSEAAKLMKERNIHALLVGSKEAISGILTEKDIIRKILKGNLDPKEVKVEEIMVVTLKTVYHSTPIRKVYREMGEEGVRHLVVVDSKGPVGMVSVTDLIRLEAQEAEGEI